MATAKLQGNFEEFDDLMVQIIEEEEKSVEPETKIPIAASEISVAEMSDTDQTVWMEDEEDSEHPDVVKELHREEFYKPVAQSRNGQ